MARKFNGKAVIYTNDGVKVIDADVRRYRSCIRDEDEAHGIRYNGDYIFIGCAKTAPPTPDDFLYNTPPMPELIPQMINFAHSKWFHLMLDLFRLAQWEPVNSTNVFPIAAPFTRRQHHFFETLFDFSKPLPELDKALYQHYHFSPAMIRFVEERYNYDDLCRL